MQIETKWLEPNKSDEEKIEQLATEVEASKTFIRLCFNRGLHTKEAIEQFTHPTIEWFNNPFDLYNMEKTVERIKKAIVDNQKITVYGDYDADGITSTVIMVETLALLGAEVDYYIPNRFVEGYGPNAEAFDNLISQGTELIVTVDNGVAGHEAISHANQLGVDVIVTDHHECPEVLPEAYSIIHPRHPEGSYPFHDLSGAGVSFKIATALLEELPEEFLELAAIGTIADIVSLTGENRALAYFGLQGIKHTQRIGLLALFKQASIDSDAIDEETVGFQIAPPINAVGRLGDASLVVELLTTFEEERARELSQLVLDKNTERKQLVKIITKEAEEKLKEQSSKSVTILYDSSWHEGVLGIVSSKITEKTNKPTIIFTLDEETKTLKGSGRSIEGFNLYDCVNQCSTDLISFGGHEMACGLSLSIDKFDDFSKKLNQQAERMMTETTNKREVSLDSVIDWDEITIDLVEELEQLKPFGQENARPLLKIESVYPKNVKKIGADRTHLKSLLTKNEKQLDMIAFQSADWDDALRSSPEIDVIGYISINEWNGHRKVQLQAIDYKTNGPIVVDYRKTSLKEELFQTPSVHFLFFQEENLNKWKDSVHPDSTYQLHGDDNVSNKIKDAKPVVFVDIPDTIESFTEAFVHYQSQQIYFYLHSPHDYYFKGMPKREDFTKLYKWLMNKKEVKLSKDSKRLIKDMKLDAESIKFMLMVFLENGFVTMKDGKLSIVSNPSKKRLEDTTTYNKRLKQIQTEEILIYSSFKELLNYLKKSI